MEKGASRGALFLFWISASMDGRVTSLSVLRVQ